MEEQNISDNTDNCRLSTLLKSSFEEYKNEIMKFFTNGSSQFLLIGPDKELLKYFINNLSFFTDFQTYWISNISLANELHTKEPVFFEEKVFVVNLDNFPFTGQIKTTSILYYILELPEKHSCHICFLSSNCRILELFEKRVISRFNYNLLFIKPLEIDGEVINIKRYKKLEFMRKYQIKPFSLESVLNLFSPLHFFLLYLLIGKKIKKNDIISDFREHSIKEFKRTPTQKIFTAFFDLLDFEIINERLDVLIDKQEFISYTKKKGSIYIKRLLLNI